MTGALGGWRHVIAALHVMEASVVQLDAEVQSSLWLHVCQSASQWDSPSLAHSIFGRLSGAEAGGQASAQPPAPVPPRISFGQIQIQIHL